MTAPGPSSMPLYLVADLWQALGCPIDRFDGYVSRNGASSTWAVLLAAVRNPTRCWKPVDGEHCVLTPHTTGLCYGPSDVGSEEPLPLPVDRCAGELRRALGIDS